MKLPPDAPQSLDVKHVSEGAPAAYPNGCHVCEVEIDPDTGIIEVVKYTAVNDFGTIINPMLVDGQMHGGVAQGIGQALLEHTVYDEQGQLLSGSYMDYAMPRAHHAPDFAVHSHPVPAKTNPLGVKGCGEAGCAGSLTSIMNAVVDALSVYGIKHIDMPATPQPGLAGDPGRAGRRQGAMTQATDLAFAARRADDIRLIAGVSAAHFVSHFYILVLPPLFAFIRADYGVSYTEIGLALTVFNAVSAVLQTPAGFLVDRINARLVLVAGLLLGAAGLPSRRLVNSYWVLIAMFGLMGIGNTVYHPADYALLSRHVAPERISQAYSVHTFAGLARQRGRAGHAAAAAQPVRLARRVPGRGDARRRRRRWCCCSSATSAPHPTAAKPRDGEPAADTSWRLLLSAPILINFVFFMLLVVRPTSACRTSPWWRSARCTAPRPVTANTALTGNLLLSAIGVLVGGWHRRRAPSRHAPDRGARACSRPARLRS